MQVPTKTFVEQQLPWLQQQPTMEVLDFGPKYQDLVRKPLPHHLVLPPQLLALHKMHPVVRPMFMCLGGQ
jgi:hypothetical protein